MFTGLIQTVETIRAIEPMRDGRRLHIALGGLADDVKVGDSICVNGACLTISSLDGHDAAFDVTTETLGVSTLTHLQPGQLVNLEAALRADDRLGGHIVQGHVDGVGTIDRVNRTAATYELWIAAEPQLLRLMIAKGSVAVDGVSLTIVAVEPARFSIALIPTTLAQTTLRSRRPGDKVNLEADLISKWINKRLDELLGRDRAPGRISLEKLREQGFA